MKEQLASIKVSLLAKEKGFDEITSNSYYTPDDGKTYTIHYWPNGCKNSEFIIKGRCSAPTQSFLQMWLREKYNINIWMIDWNDKYGVQVTNKIETLYQSKAIGSYEESLDEGLIEALNIIKL